MTLQPLDDKVVIRPDAALKSHGLILLPDGTFKPRFGEVLAVGPGKWRYERFTHSMAGTPEEQSKELEGVYTRVPMSLRVGDRVAFSHYGTDGIEVDGEELLVITEDRVLAVVPPGADVPELAEAGPLKRG